MNLKLNVFFLPFAGGNKYSYRDFKEKAPSFINIISLEYPGRGAKKLIPDRNGFSLATQNIADKKR